MQSLETQKARSPGSWNTPSKLGGRSLSIRRRMGHPDELLPLRLCSRRHLPRRPSEMKRLLRLWALLLVALAWSSETSACTLCAHGCAEDEPLRYYLCQT